jgi:hypothetical protein
LYNTAKTGQQEYGAEFILNESKPSVTNLMRTFLASLICPYHRGGPPIIIDRKSRSDEYKVRLC